MQGATATAVVCAQGQVAAGAQTTVPASTPTPQNPKAIVSPAHGSRAAAPTTTISIRGTTRDELGAIVVMGSIAGAYSGVLRDHPDGNGVSWIPDAPFAEFEVVIVSADIALSDAMDGRARFQIASPGPRVRVPTDIVDTRDEYDEALHHFRSRPDLMPPTINVVTNDGSVADTAMALITPIVPEGQNGALIADVNGDPVWYHLPPDPRWSVLCLRQQEWNGEPVLVWWQGAKLLGYGFGHWVIADQHYQMIAEVQVGNGLQGWDCHDLILTDRGTAISFAYHALNWRHEGQLGIREGVLVDGVLQEVDVETGLVYWEWHTADHIDPDEFYGSPPTNPLAQWDYAHINSVALDDDGHVLISCRNTWAIYKIHRETGEVIWRLGGKRSDFVMEPGTRFAWQHDAQRLPDGLFSLFDNHHHLQENEPHYTSRGLVLDLDEEKMIARVAREYEHPAGTLSVTQGNMQTRSDGSVVVGWGSAPNYSVFAADGTLAYDARFRSHTQSYRAYFEDWTGLPIDPLDVATKTNADGSVTVYASWNGATHVAAWRVVDGPDAARAAELGHSLRTGFETTIIVQVGTEWMAVEALDSTGEVLESRKIEATSR